MSVADAARELEVSPRRIRQLIEAGVLVARLLSVRFYVVERESVERYKVERRPSGRPPRSGA